MPATQILCPCNRCAKTPLGYDYQSAQLVKKHLANYGDSRVKASATATQDPDLNESASTEDNNPSAQHRSPSPLQPAPSLNGDNDIGIRFDSGNDWDDWDWLDIEQEPESADDIEQDMYNPASLPLSPCRSLSPAPQEQEQPDRFPAHGDTEFLPISLPDIQEPRVDSADGAPDLSRPAFREKAHIRLAYLQAAVGNVYNGLSVKQATDQLNGTLDSHLISGTLPTYPRPV